MRDRCRSCGAPIIWAKTASGRSMPVSDRPADGGNISLEATGNLFRAVYVSPGDGTHVAHFVDCPHAAAHRQPRKPR